MILKYRKTKKRLLNRKYIAGKTHIVYMAPTMNKVTRNQITSLLHPYNAYDRFNHRKWDKLKICHLQSIASAELWLGTDTLRHPLMVTVAEDFKVMDLCTMVTQLGSSSKLDMTLIIRHTDLRDVIINLKGDILEVYTADSEELQYLYDLNYSSLSKCKEGGIKYRYGFDNISKKDLRNFTIKRSSDKFIIGDDYIKLEFSNDSSVLVFNQDIKNAGNFDVEEFIYKKIVEQEQDQRGEICLYHLLCNILCITDLKILNSLLLYDENSLLYKKVYHWIAVADTGSYADELKQFMILLHSGSYRPIESGGFESLVYSNTFCLSKEGKGILISYNSR